MNPSSTALLVSDSSTAAIPLHLVSGANWPEVKAALPAAAQVFAEAQGFDPAGTGHCIVPDAGGQIAAVLCAMGDANARRIDPFAPGRLAALLPAGTYRLEGKLPDAGLAALAWLLSAYRFDRYRMPKPTTARLVAPAGADVAETLSIAAAVARGRDLINTPANDCGPAEIEAAIRAVGARFGAGVTAIVGDDLLAAGFPMIHAVGRASVRAPRLVDLIWGNPNHPKVTLVGKGVCFDTGGLNLKPEAGMLMMKKDMGGAAAAIAAAEMIMAAGLPVRLRLIVPTVENSVSGNAFRPGDVLASRKGLSVEIGNTDAEGRLILGDALALADEEAPELLIDYATLTGAARVALGPDLPPLYSHDDALAAEMQAIGMAVNDPVWRMPLWPPYDAMLASKIADVNHVSTGGFAGSITAALFLARFVEKAKAHAHLDIFAWSQTTKPGRPEGAEIMGARLTYALVKARYRT